MSTLGQEEFVTGFTLEGCPTEPELVDILLELIHTIHMTPDGSPDVRCYPNSNGKGGYGCQVYQPLTESWVIGGTWEEHKLTRVVISSCKHYMVSTVKDFLSWKIGKVVTAFRANM